MNLYVTTVTPSAFDPDETTKSFSFLEARKFLLVGSPRVSSEVFSEVVVIETPSTSSSTEEKSPVVMVDSRVLLMLMDVRTVRIHVMAVMKVVSLAFPRMKEARKVLQILLAWASLLDGGILSVD